jgi:two-component system sensor histidine kinase MprB
VSLRTRLTVAGGGAVFVALAIASLVIFVSVRSNLRDQIDFSLIQSAQAVGLKSGASTEQPPAGLPLANRAKLRAARAGQPLLGTAGSSYFQVIPKLGSATNGGPAGFVPVESTDASVARGLAPPYFRDVRYRGVAMRLYTMRLANASDGLVRTARPLTDANATIARVRWILLALTLGGALAAALLGRLAANAVLRPVRALAGAVREVSATRDLKRRIPVSGRDELASLAADFNAMLAGLDESQQVQQQLIADASHELRTPLTAHRANIELLARDDLGAGQRQRVLGAAVRTIGELSTLVGDLIEAARDGRSVDARQSLALDELVEGAIERARHRAPELRFDSRLEPHQLVGARSRIERALDNVLDNAIKWSPPGASVEVELAGGTLSVRDHGPGVAEADLPHVFDRFYRAAAARALPGSGLGLAIVRQTVEDHGGVVAMGNAEGGGALVTLRFEGDEH